MAFQALTINEIMPPELLGEIFLHCLPQDPLKHQQPDVTIAPMLLCHICSHWREIALKIPRIWTHLYHAASLKGSIYNRTFGQRDRTFLRWWLARVGEVPAFLRLEFKKDNGKEEDGLQEIQSNDFMAIMIQCMINARYLSLDFHYTDHLLDHYGPRPLSCPNLDTLVMHQGFQRYDSVLDSKSYIPINNTQYVRRCVIENVYISPNDAPSILNFSNITHLHLYARTTLNVWFSLLQECVNLMYGSFIISLITAELQGPVVRRPQVLPHLRQLSFQSYDKDLQHSFLEGFHLPALSAMRIDKQPTVSVDYLHRLLASTPAVRTLHLGAKFMTRPALLPSVCIPGDLNPTMTSIPLSSVARHLESIYFEAFSCLVPPYGLDLARSVLTGDWLQLGRPGNRISCVHLGSHWNLEGQETAVEELCFMVDELRKSLSPDVELALRPVDDIMLWLSQWKDGNFVDEFEDLIGLGPWAPS